MFQFFRARLLLAFTAWWSIVVVFGTCLQLNAIVNLIPQSQTLTQTWLAGLYSSNRRIPLTFRNDTLEVLSGVTLYLKRFIKVHLVLLWSWGLSLCIFGLHEFHRNWLWRFHWRNCLFWFDIVINLIGHFRFDFTIFKILVFFTQNFYFFK